MLINVMLELLWPLFITVTVKYFNFVGTTFRSLTNTDMCVDTWIREFQSIRNMTKVNKFFVGILNSLIALPTKYTQLNVQRNLIISKLNYIFTNGLRWY